ncbi:MAG: ATP-binding protein, partial [Actinomyces sp.]|nr:ATP-binding protein [Actinomyces sp.]
TRGPLGWVAVSLLLVALAYLAFEAGLVLRGPLLGLAATALLASQVGLLAAVLVLVLPEHGRRLGGLLSRATVWGLLTALVVALYLALVMVVGRVLPVGGEDAGVLAAAALALLVTPARHWLQVRVDRLVHGVGGDAEVLLQRLGSDLSREGSRSTTLETVAEGLRRDLRLRAVAVRSDPAVSAVSALVGTPLGTPLRQPLFLRGRPVGFLDVWVAPGRRPSATTVQVLERASGLVAATLELAQVNEQLSAARARLLQVRHEERRILRRELHDGLGPALAGAGLALAAIRNRTPQMAPPEAALMERLQEELTSRAEDLRDLARALLPPALDEGRLGEALEVLASLFTDSRLTVQVEAEDADGIDTTRQVAVYHIAAEAVLNAHRHADASHCTIRVSGAAGGPVTLTVTDDGRGLDAVAPGDDDGPGIVADREGVGMNSMRERAREIGGTLVVSPGAGTRQGRRGTTVTAVLP